MRKEEVTEAVSVVQRFWKTKLCRKRYLVLRFLSIWLQSICRRLIAKQTVNKVALYRLMNEEKYQLSKLARAEADNVLNLKLTSRIIGSGFLRNGSSRFDRILLAYDIHFDISFSYPEGMA